MIKKELLEKLDCKEVPKKLVIGIQAEYADTDYSKRIYSKGMKRNWSNVAEKDYSNKQSDKIKNVGESNKYTGQKSQGAYFKGTGAKKYLRTKDIVRHSMYGIGIIIATNERTIKAENMGKYVVSFPGYGRKTVTPNTLTLVKPKEVSGGIRQYSGQQKTFKDESNK